MPTLAPPKKILTVEDNAIVSADVRAILEAAGYDVCPDARDGAEALECAGGGRNERLVLKPFSEHGLLTAVRNRIAQRESEDFRLRSMVESMLRDGADEHEIVRALGAETGRSQRSGRRPILRLGVQRVAAIARRRAR